MTNGITSIISFKNDLDYPFFLSYFFQHHGGYSSRR
jgi:hypothetical protein